MNIKELQAALAAKRTELKALTDAENPTQETVAQAKALAAEVDELSTKLADAEELERITKANNAAIEQGKKAVNTLPNQAGKNEEGNEVKYYAKGIKPKYASTEEKAHALGLSLVVAATKGRGERASKALENLQGMGYDTKDMVTNVEANGGFLVPVALSSEIINQADTYGVARRQMRIYPMSAPIEQIPVLTQRLTASPVGEATAYTEGQLKGSTLELVARKWGVTVDVSTEISDDAITQIGDLFAFEAGRAFAYAEDNALFNGDGTAAFHTIKGLKGSFDDLTYASAAGMTVAAGATAASVTKTNVEACISTLPGWVTNPAFYVSQWGKAMIFDRLITNAGGVTASEMQNGIAARFLGYPVIVTPVLPTSDASGQVLFYFGDLNEAAKMGQPAGAGITVSTSDQERFSEDITVWKARERFDIKVHNIGSTSAAGAIVGVYSA